MRRYGYHPGAQCPDYGDGASWEAAIRLHHRTFRRSDPPANPASRPAATAGGCDDLSAQTPGPAGDLFGRLAR